MVDIVRPSYGEAWASVGEKVSPTLTKIQGGWIQEMMPYQWENFLQNRQDTALLYMLQKGVPEWDASQEYIAGKSVVTYQTNLYISILDSTNVLPTVQASWKKLNPLTSSSGVVTIAGGGTGASTAADARTNLGLGSIATATAPTSNGVVVRSAADTLISRSITGTANNIVVTNGDGVAGDISINTGSNVALLNTDSSWTSTGSIRLPSGSTSQQGTSTPGRVRFNLETDEFHGAYSDGWKVLAKPASAEQTSITDFGNFYTSSNVEGALQEVGLKASFVKDAILFYPEYTAASAAAVALPDGQRVEIDADETHEGFGTQYVVNGGALVFVRYTEQLRIDLASKESGKGAALVNHGDLTVAQWLDGSALGFNTAAELAASEIPAGVSCVRTTRAVDGGQGGQLFVRTEASASADGYYIIQSMDGAKWRGTESPNPHHFGAIDGTDVTAALTRWGAFIANNDGPCEWTVRGTISAPVVISAGNKFSKQINGKIELSEPAAGVSCLLEFRDFVNARWGDAEYIGSAALASRKVDHAFRFYGCKYLSAGSFYGLGCKRFFIDLDYYTTEFNFQHINALYNGVNKQQKIAFTYSTHFRIGSGVDQRSVLTFAGAIPTHVDVGDGFICNGRYFHIRYMDHTGGNFHVFPWMTDVDEANIPSGFFCAGGGFRHHGGETNAGYISRFSGLVNGHDIQADELYPVSVGKLASQLSGVSYRAGASFSSAYRGGTIADAYIEDPEVFFVELGQGGESPFTVMQTGPFTPVVPYLHPYITNADFSINAVLSTPSVRTGGGEGKVSIMGEQAPVISTAFGNTPVTTVASGEAAGSYGKSVKLVLDKAAYSAHGSYSILIPIYGTETGAPGSVTFTAEAGVTVMGGDSVTSTLAACLILATFRNNNWTLLKSGGLTYVTA